MELRDGRVTLRPWRAEDAATVYAACQDPEIQRWIPLIPRPYELEHARAFVAGEVGLGPHQFAITLEGPAVGSIGMEAADGTGHIGYWLAREARGRGTVTRALVLLCRYAFDELGLARLELVTDPDNAASQRVAEKAGFRREAVLRSHMLHPDGRRRDSVMFSLLPGELVVWRKSAG
jgi:RimJ/RimL family protein N-acetyltransferase